MSAAAPRRDSDGGGTSSRVIARNTAVQVVGEILGKLASLGLYVVMARELGQEGFGDFTFALSFSLLLTTIAGLGTDVIVTREIARERNPRHPAVWNAVAVKLALGALATAVALGVVFAGDYDAEARAAVAILTAATLVELLAKTVFGVFQGVDDMRPVALALLIQRLFTALVGIGALLLGAGVVPVSLVYLGGTLLAIAWATRRMLSRFGRPLVDVSFRRARGLAKESLPLGLNVVFSTVLFRADATILSLIKGNDAVALYGVAYRLLESTLFLSYAFVASLLPTLSRAGRDTTPTIGETYQAALKVTATGLLPVGTGLVLFAHPVIQTLYGHDFEAAESAMRLLGGAAALYGVSYLSGYVLVAQGRQRVIPWITAVVAVQNVVLNLAFVPRWSFDAAAAATSVSELTLAALMTGFALRATGRVGVARIVCGPVAGCLAMVGVAALLDFGLLAAVLSLPAYVVALLLVERGLFPQDLRLLATMVRPRPAPDVR